jgi:hypothetical protein
MAGAQGMSGDSLTDCDALVAEPGDDLNLTAERFVLPDPG